MVLVVPAVLPSSHDDLEEKVAFFASLPHISRIQIDVVDGRFASPASWPYAPLPSKAGEGRSAVVEPPYPELEAMVRRGEMLPFLDRIAYEVDLMCLDAQSAVDAWLAVGASRFTFHAESIIDLPQFLARVRARYGCGIISCDLISIGLAISVESDLALIEPHLDQVDYVQFMGIARIGRQGQPFDPRVLERVRAFHARHPKMLLQVDGGVSPDRVPELVAAGATRLVAGSALLRASNPVAALEELERASGASVRYT